MGFRRRLIGTGVGIAAFVVSVLAMLPHGSYVGAILSALVVGVVLYDWRQKSNPLRRNYPLLGRLHDVTHFLGWFFGLKPRIAPFAPEILTLVQQRADGLADISAFGAQLPQRLTIRHAIASSDPKDVATSVVIGGEGCACPYEASVLNISALAFGALSNAAIEALSRAAAQGGFLYNTGEAGLAPAFLRGGGDLIWQVGTGYFGCRDRDGAFDPAMFQERARLDNIKMIEVKLSQGSKPAKGGYLPGEKVSAEVAEVCQIPMGVDSILSPRHSAFSNPVGLLEFLVRLRDLSGGKPVGFKLCVGQPRDLFAIGKAMIETEIFPDFISVDGSEGGTGAAPIEFQSFVGMPLVSGLAFVHQMLVGLGIRGQVRVLASGKIATGADMVAAMVRGADVCMAARAFMIAMGCIQALECGSNACPTGIATQNRRLSKAVMIGHQAERIVRFHSATVESFRALVASTGNTTAAALGPELLGEPPYPIGPGQLLDGDIPAPFANDWEQASSKHF
ncbi:MAG: FMN-binding glutamate synthase family protein [Haliangiales bacterium]